MKKIKILSVVLVLLICLFFPVPSSSQVFDSVRRGKYPYSYMENVTVKTSKILSQCHKVQVGRMYLDYDKKSRVCLSNIGDPVSYQIEFYNHPSLMISISNFEVFFHESNLNQELRIKLIDSRNGMKSYEISGKDYEGVEFKRIFEGNSYNKFDSPITFYKYSLLEMCDRDYQPTLGKELMEGDEPVLLELVKKWAKSFNKAKVVDLQLN